MINKSKFIKILILFIIMIFVINITGTLYSDKIEESSGEVHSVDYELDEDGYEKVNGD